MNIIEIQKQLTALADTIANLDQIIDRGDIAEDIRNIERQCCDVKPKTSLDELTAMIEKHPTCVSFEIAERIVRERMVAILADKKTSFHSWIKLESSLYGESTTFDWELWTECKIEFKYNGPTLDAMLEKIPAEESVKAKRLAVLEARKQEAEAEIAKLKAPKTKS